MNLRRYVDGAFSYWLTYLQLPNILSAKTSKTASQVYITHLLTYSYVTISDGDEEVMQQPVASSPTN